MLMPERVVTSCYEGLSKAFIVPATSNQVKGDQYLPSMQRSSDSHHLTTDKPYTATIINSCDEFEQKSLLKTKRFSLVSVVAWVLRAAKMWQEIGWKNKEQVKPEKTTQERNDAPNHLLLKAQTRWGCNMMTHCEGKK